MASLTEAVTTLHQAAAVLAAANGNEASSIAAWLSFEVAVAGSAARVLQDARCDAAVSAAQAAAAGYAGQGPETAPDGHAMVLCNVLDALAACAKGGPECYARWPHVASIAVASLASQVAAVPGWLPRVSPPQQVQLVGGLQKLFTAYAAVAGLGLQPGCRPRLDAFCAGSVKLFKEGAALLAAAATCLAAAAETSSGRSQAGTSLVNVISNDNSGAAGVWGPAGAAGQPPLAPVLGALLASCKGSGGTGASSSVLAVLQPAISGLCACFRAFAAHCAPLRGAAAAAASVVPALAAALRDAWGVLEARAVPPLVSADRATAGKALSLSPLLNELWQSGGSLHSECSAWAAVADSPVAAAAAARFAATAQLFVPVFVSVAECERVFGRGAAGPALSPTAAVLVRQAAAGAGTAASQLCANPLLQLPQAASSGGSAPPAGVIAGAVAPVTEELVGFYMRQAFLALSVPAGPASLKTGSYSAELVAFMQATHALRSAAVQWAAACRCGALASEPDSVAAAAAAGGLPRLLAAAERAAFMLALAAVGSTGSGSSAGSSTTPLNVALGAYLYGAPSAAPAWAALATLQGLISLTRALTTPPPAAVAAAGVAGVDVYRALCAAKVCPPAEAAVAAVGAGASAAPGAANPRDATQRQLREAAPRALPLLRRALWELWAAPQAGAFCGHLALWQAAPALPLLGASPAPLAPSSLYRALVQEALVDEPLLRLAEAVVSLALSLLADAPEPAAAAPASPASLLARQVAPHFIAAATLTRSAATNPASEASHHGPVSLQQYGVHGLAALLAVVEGGGGASGAHPEPPTLTGLVLAALFAATGLSSSAVYKPLPAAATAISSFCALLGARRHSAAAAAFIRTTFLPALATARELSYTASLHLPEPAAAAWGRLVAGAVVTTAGADSLQPCAQPASVTAVAVSAAVSAFARAVVADGRALLDAAFGKPGVTPVCITQGTEGTHAAAYDAAAAGFFRGWRLLGAALVAAGSASSEAAAAFFSGDDGAALDVGARLALLLSTGEKWFVVPPAALGAGAACALPGLVSASDLSRGAAPPAGSHPALAPALGKALSGAGGEGAAHFRLEAAGTALAVVAATLPARCFSGGGPAADAACAYVSVLLEKAAVPLAAAATPVASGAAEAAHCVAGVRAFAASLQRVGTPPASSAAGRAATVAQLLGALEATLSLTEAE